MSPGEKSFIESLTVKGAAAMAAAFVSGQLGVDLPDAALQEIAEAIVQIVFYVGLLAVAIGRARARGPLI